MLERFAELKPENYDAAEEIKDDALHDQFKMDQRALHYSMKYAMFELRYLRVKLEVTLNQDLMKLNRNRKGTQGIHLKCNSSARSDKTVTFTFGS